ncbi:MULTISPECIES: feruloyl-CoA synthase [unclassified Massilia]|uniref:feruloyl-CoA synthase n=1 Tax=unclassified Massilia TaxID=2609279 RepID=UPI0017814844|nr:MULTISPECIES: feruloyl-CoA synthase [unclassified Massilia]MBD8530524.1 feruloyl-CoA synthase [Massilia sp. CFBP 13647]MBD8674178.1 feruloyl-CoA synthase [Massilia sp. CFBP 13721]
MNEISMAAKGANAAKRRQVALGNPEVAAWQEDGVWHVDAITPLAPFPARFTDRLVSGAKEHPERTLVARRGPDGEWIRLSYADVLQSARRIGQALLDRGLSEEHPLVILSGNDLEHFQLALGAMYAGIPYSPLSPAYSLVATDPAKLRDLIEQLTPGAVFACDGTVFGRAIEAVLPADAELIVARGEVAGRAATAFDALLATEPTSIDARNAQVGPSTIAKFLFTSGSTKKPKAVITTHQMLCSNQQMLLQTFPFFGEEPPVLLDWLPWNHTFGGSHNVGIVLYNGGTMYLDDGRPTPKDFATTLRNLREIAPTVYFNIPVAWEMLAEALETDDQLAHTFFSRVKLFFCAGAGLSQAAWEHLDAVALRRCGESIRIMTGLGMTETSPSCTFGTGPISRAGYVGVPAPGCKVKLVPLNGKLEARFHGPHVTPGYWRAPHLTAEAFDADGYYCTGDALRFVDDAHPEHGFMFDGRIAEDFKLSSGTFVSVGPLRARVISQGAPFVQDAVVTGLDRHAIGLMVFPRMDNCLALAKLPAGTPAAEVLASAPVRDFFRQLLATLNTNASGSSTRVERLLLLAEPPSIDAREQTDKGSINQAAVLSRRAALVDAMYDGTEAQTIVAA